MTVAADMKRQQDEACGSGIPSMPDVSRRHVFGAQRRGDGTSAHIGRSPGPAVVLPVVMVKWCDPSSPCRRPLLPNVKEPSGSVRPSGKAAVQAHWSIGKGENHHCVCCLYLCAQSAVVSKGEAGLHRLSSRWVD